MTPEPPDNDRPVVVRGPDAPPEALWSLVLGACAVAVSLLWLLSGAWGSAAAWGPFLPLLVVALLAAAVMAIVFGVISLRRANATGVDVGRGMAVTGLVLGIVQLGGWLLFPLLWMLWCASGTSSGGGDCDCGSGDSDGSSPGDGCADCSVAPIVPLLFTRAARRPTPPAGPRPQRAQRLDGLLAHHPDTPAFGADVFRLGGVRLCVGCFTVYPAFVATLVLLVAAAPPAPWWTWLAAGGGLALAQAASAAGWTRWRWLKATVKAMLGSGLALLLHGVVESPWPPALRAAFLLGLLSLAALSVLPRRRRLAHACRTDVPAAQPHR